ncbi:hypothetical protein [Pseudomonas fluorescens]|uniref:hypothetical protein n=1 Tax=Pseudomonas fluorescens TaxID=294 RepID=UPI001242FC2F|nr:hypothetical protein [Pseudomonas fluorescens]VVN46971.1 hypothetical protein PS639_05839 [Pseudomonas fluorescens]
MSLDLFSFVLGAVLLLIGLIGGGIEAKEIKIPSVGTNIRIGAGIFGIGFIILGLWLAGHLKEPKSEVQTEPAALIGTSTEKSDRISFVVRDQLGQDQKKEKIILYIGGTSVGEFIINEANPAASISVNLPAEGDYEYALSGFVDIIESETIKRFSIVGQGTLPVTHGAIFEFNVEDLNGNTKRLTLKHP